MEMVEEVVIVGAGIAGLATALALKRIGIRALVLERSPELRTTGAALTLFPNAWLALDALGVSHKLTALYAPLKRSIMNNIATGEKQEVSFSRTDGVEVGPRTVHRKTLLEALADELPVESIRFSSKVAAIESQTVGDSSIPIVHLDDGTVIKSKILIGCDGVHSVVAHWLGLKEAANSGRSAVRGLAVFPEGHGLNPEVHQFINVGIRAGFVPLNDKEIYWFFTCKDSPKGNKLTGHPETIQQELLENYAKDFPPLYLDVIRHSDLSTLSWAPLLFRYPWEIMLKNLRKGNVMVAGDAMHPMTPDLGQGGCAALEDAVVLGRHIGELFLERKTLVSRDIGKAIDGYIKERRGRVAWLVTGSYLSGWIQQGGYSWWMKFLRDDVFYRLLFTRVVTATVQYDCGKLPSAGFPGELGNTKKID